MNRTKRNRSGLAAGIGALVTIGGCPTGQVVGTLLALSTITFVLGQTGVIDVRAGSAQPARSAGVFSLNLPGPAEDEPDSAQLQLGTVRALDIGGTSKSQQQSLSGSAIVSVYCAAGTSSNPCDDGVFIGHYNLELNAGTVTVSNPSLPVPAAALPFVISGEFGVCFEVTATIDVRIVIEDMAVSFGEDNGPNPAPVNNNPQPNDVDLPDDSDDSSDTPQNDPPADRIAPVFTSCPDDQQVEAAEDGFYTVPDFTGSATASDNLSAVTMSQVPPAGAMVGVGRAPVQLTARDASGNTATCDLVLEVLDPSPVSGGFTKAFISHAGSERIIAGADVVAGDGYTFPDIEYTVQPLLYDRWTKSYALSGFGTRVWFRIKAARSLDGQDRTQIWSMNIDGTGAMRSPVPADAANVFGAHLETNEDGSVCIVNMDGRLFRARPGEALEELYDFSGEFDFRGAYKVDDAGERCWLVDLNGRGIHSMDLNSRPYFPTVIINRENQAINGRDPRPWHRRNSTWPVTSRRTSSVAITTSAVRSRVPSASRMCSGSAAASWRRPVWTTSCRKSVDASRRMT